MLAVLVCTNMCCMQVGYPSEWPEWCHIESLHEDTFLENYAKTEKCRVRASSDVDTRTCHVATHVRLALHVTRSIIAKAFVKKKPERLAMRMCSDCMSSWMQYEKEKKKLREKVKRTEWTSAGTTDVNAYYSQKVSQTRNLHAGSS
jgi:hypothetical protein